MSIISNKNFISDDIEENELDCEYTLPTLITSKPEVISMNKSMSCSAFLHIIIPALVWIISIILLYM